MTFRPGVSRTIGIIGVAAIVVVAFLFAVLGTKIPYPEEARRVRHPAGFSIIQPVNWELTTFVQPPSVPTAMLMMVPNKPEGRGGGLWAMKFQGKPKIETTGKKAMHEGQFMGQPAWVLEDTKHEKVWTRSYIFERGGEWYQVSLARPAPEAIMGKEWTAFVESFRIESTLSAPASLPSSQPVASQTPSTAPALSAP